MLYLRKDMQMSEKESGVMYSVTAILTFTYGLLIGGYMIDKWGVKMTMVTGSICLAIARLGISLANRKWMTQVLFTTLFPLGLSLCKCYSIEITISRFCIIT